MERLESRDLQSVFMLGDNLFAGNGEWFSRGIDESGTPYAVRFHYESNPAVATDWDTGAPVSEDFGKTVVDSAVALATGPVDNFQLANEFDGAHVDVFFSQNGVITQLRSADYFASYVAPKPLADIRHDPIPQSPIVAPLAPVPHYVVDQSNPGPYAPLMVNVVQNGNVAQQLTPAPLLFADQDESGVIRVAQLSTQDFDTFTASLLVVMDESTPLWK